MYSANFDYYRAASLSEAVALLQQHPGAKLLAGGHSLLPQMKLRVAQPPALIDIGRLAELRGLTIDGYDLTIGALTTHHQLATSPIVQAHCPLLAQAAALIGDQQVRNRGTIGGSLAYADPAADLPTVIVALGAALTATGPHGSRTLAADQFYTDLFTTALTDGEVLTSIRVPIAEAGVGGHYAKHEHPASGYAVVGVAAYVRQTDSVCRAASLVVGGAVANPTHARAAEAALVGQPLTAAHLTAAAALVAAAITQPLSDHYASAEYRAHLAGVLAERALTQAAAPIQ